MNFDKSPALFPSREKHIILNHCAIAPLFASAARRASEILQGQTDDGLLVVKNEPGVMKRLHEAAGELLQTSAENISFLRNTAEGLSLVANGYPLSAGDEIISYVHEYPSNHYPWKIQEGRGAKLVLLPDADPTAPSGESSGKFPASGRPRGFSFLDLERLVTSKTRIIAVSHVQFTSGWAVDLPKLGAFAKARNIDLILDVSQSLGSLPVFPEEWNIAGAASAGWKWLLGPVGTGLLYTSPALREKLTLTMAGADVMKQGEDYLNHAWQPFRDGRMFEYSTPSFSLAAALAECIREVPLRYGIGAVQAEIFRLQDVFLSRLDPRITPLRFENRERSAILSLMLPQGLEPVKAVEVLGQKTIRVTARGGYVRIAPHIANTDEDMEKAAEALGDLLAGA